MKLDRHVIERKRQLLVPIPPEVRDHLSVVGGARVWWHIARSGLVVMTTTGRSRAGRPRTSADCAACGKYRAELDRLRRELRERSSATPAQLFRQGYMQAVSKYGDVADRMDAQREMLRDIRVLLRELVTRPTREERHPDGLQRPGAGPRGEARVGEEEASNRPRVESAP